MNIRVAIIEDEKDISQMLQQIIDSSEGFECKHVFHHAEDAIKEIPLLDLDVVLTDINLPGKSGIECILELKPLCPNINFLICTSFEDSETVFAALKAGASGYLVKTVQPSKLLDALVDIHHGGSPMSSNIARKVVMSFKQAVPSPELALLTSRENEILEFLSQGLRYKEIADKLYLSTETVRTHIRNIYQKLQVNSRTEAINVALNKKK